MCSKLMSMEMKEGDWPDLKQIRICVDVCLGVMDRYTGSGQYLSKAISNGFQQGDCPAHLRLF